MHDFVVVGAGPAGSRFARSVAERGRDVLVFEQGEIGEPLACSGHVSLDVWEYVPASAREGLFQNDIYGARFHLDAPEGENGKTGDGRAGDAFEFYKREPVSNAIDRVGLDTALADAASEAGAEVRDGHTVTGVEERRDRVRVEVKGPDGVEGHEARMIVGADGPRSRVRRECGLPEPDELLHGVLGFDPDSDHQDFVDVHLTVPGFFAWRIPRGAAGVEYGLAVKPGDDAPARFDEFLDGYGVREAICERCSGAIPIGPPRRVTGRRSLLVGDAAGQTKPFTGGGILYGMRAADVAARVVDPGHPETLGAYERGWREELKTDIRLGKLVRAGYSLPRPIQRVGLGLFSGEIGVHMDRPSTLLSREQLKTLLSRG